MVNQTPDVTIFPYLGTAVACVFNIFLPLLSNHKAFLTASNVVKYRLHFCSQSRKFFGIPCFSRNLSGFKIKLQWIFQLAAYIPCSFTKVGGGVRQRDCPGTTFKHMPFQRFFEKIRLKFANKAVWICPWTCTGESWGMSLPGEET